jgi:hypothetical protein
MLFLCPFSGSFPKQQQRAPAQANDLIRAKEVFP